MNRRVLLKPKAETETIKPFLTEGLGPLSTPTVTTVGKSNRVVPSNAQNKLRSDLYTEELPELLDEKIRSARDFLLQEVIPPALAFYNGMQDAKEIASVSLEQDPQIDSLMGAAGSFIEFGLKLKLLDKVAEAMDLTPTQRTLLLVKTLATELKVTDMNGVRSLIDQVKSLTPITPAPKPTTPTKPARKFS